MKTTPSITTFEELKALSNFVENNIITPQNFSKVITDYVIRDHELYCCLTDNNGKCGQAHYHGYVIELDNGSLSIMGNDCAARKFGATGSIFEGINIFRKNKEVEKKLGRVKDYVDSINTYRDKLNIISNYIDSIKKFYNEFLITFGGYTLKYLEKRYKTNNTEIKLKTFNYDADDNLEYIATHTIGNIQSLNLFDKRDVNDYSVKINRLYTALRDAELLTQRLLNGDHIDSAELNRRSKAILTQLNTFDEFENKINTTIDDINKFKKSDLTSLCFLSTDEYSSKNIAKYILEQNNVFDKTPETFIRQLEIKYATRYRCHHVESAEHASYWRY